MTKQGVLKSLNIEVDGVDYDLRVLQRVSAPPEAPRLVVVSHQPNRLAQSVCQVCIRAVQRFTSEQHELWVVDNNSPWSNVKWLLQWPEVNVVLIRTEPIPPEQRGTLARSAHWLRRIVLRSGQSRWGSYANAIALELAVRLIAPQSRYLMSLHMDTMPSRPGWLTYLKSKMDDRVAAAGVRMEVARVPEGVLHVLGHLLCFQLFRQLNLSFLPELPQYDVGDRLTVALREAGYEVFACTNTHRTPRLVETIPASSPFRTLDVGRSFDDDGNVIFLHLGRGVSKARHRHRSGTTAQEWVRFALEHLLT